MGLNMQRPCDVIYNKVYRGKRDLEDLLADYLQDHKITRSQDHKITRSQDHKDFNLNRFVSEIQIGAVSQCVSQEESRQFTQMSYVNGHRCLIRLSSIFIFMDTVHWTGNAKGKFECQLRPTLHSDFYSKR